jgi:hypothetical protein
MVMSEGVPESTPSRLGLLNAVIEVLKLADGDLAPCHGRDQCADANTAPRVSYSSPQPISR